MKRKIYIFVMIFSILLGNFSMQKQVFAAKKDVTKTLKNKKQIEKMTKEFRDMVGIYTFYQLDSGERKTFYFSKESDRRKMLKYSYWKHGELSFSKQKSLSKQLFGKSVTKKTKQLMGDWGLSWPVIKMTKIYKVSGSHYEVYAKMYEEYESGKKQNRATLKFNFKKSSKAKYGYYITSMTIKKL